MSTTTNSIRPASITRLTHYYQGRPNVAFLDRYGTVPGRYAHRSD
jgi:hypothetical protein